MAGMDIYTLSKILGHSSVTITEQGYCQELCAKSVCRLRLNEVSQQ